VRWGRGITTKEALARAHTICAQTVRENYRILSKTNDSTRLTVEAAEAEKGVLSARIIDPKTNGVLAPTKDYNKTVNDVYSLIAIKKVTEAKEETVSVSMEDDIWLVAQPINVYSPDSNENVLTGIVLVQFQITSEINSTFQPLVEAALFATLFSLAAFFLIYKMVTYPVVQMSEQLDSALKGDNVAISSEMKMPELEQLATQMNFAVSRLKQASGGAATITVEDAEIEDVDYIRAVTEMDQGANDAILLLDRDRKVRYVGRVTEDLLSMRSQYAMGQNLVDACKDPGFSGTALDLANQVFQSLGEKQTAMLDVNGFARNMTAIGHKNRGGDLRFILLIVQMKDVKN
jgi:methyl-accepting chemotaxis protein